MVTILKQDEKLGSLLWLGAGKIAAQFALLEDFEVFSPRFGVRRNSGAVATGFSALSTDFNQVDCLAGLGLEQQAINQVVITLTPPARSREGYELGYVAASRNLIESLKRLGQSPERVIFVSSTSVYGQSDGQWVDESSPTEPDHFSGQCLLAAEALWRDSGWPSCSVRFSGIYGPGRFRLLQQVAKGVGGSKTPPVYSNRIHEVDCARVIAHLLRLETLPEAIIATDNDSAPQWQVRAWLAEQMGVGEHSLTETDTGGASKRLSNQRLLDTGFDFRYPSYQQGYPDIIEQYLSD